MGWGVVRNLRGRGAGGVEPAIRCARGRGRRGWRDAEGQSELGRPANSLARFGGLPCWLRVLCNAASPQLVRGERAQDVDVAPRLAWLIIRKPAEMACFCGSRMSRKGDYGKWKHAFQLCAASIAMPIPLGFAPVVALPTDTLAGEALHDLIAGQLRLGRRLRQPLALD